MTPSFFSLSDLLLFFAFFLLLSFIGAFSLSRCSVRDLGLLRLRMLLIRSRNKACAICNTFIIIRPLHKLRLNFLRAAPLLRCILSELLRGNSCALALAQGGLSVGWVRVEGHLYASGGLIGNIEEVQSARKFQIVRMCVIVKKALKLVRV